MKKKPLSKIGGLAIILAMSSFIQYSEASIANEFQNNIQEQLALSSENTELFSDINANDQDAKASSAIENNTTQRILKDESERTKSKNGDLTPNGISNELLSNNGFENGASNWIQATRTSGGLFASTSIITNNSSLSANGSWYALLITNASSRDILQGNDFVLPSNVTSLTIDYNGVFVKNGTCTSGYGQGYNDTDILLYDATTNETVEIVVLNNANTEESDTKYYNYTFNTTTDLSDRAGHTMSIEFTAYVTNPSCTIGLYLDDVNLTATINTPIYRLYNTVTGVHLYTKGVSDRDYILNKFPAFEFTDNAPAFYASLTEQAGLTPIYRLYNTVTGVHLYTKGVSDRDYILNKFPAFEFTDGVPAFYAEI